MKKRVILTGKAANRLIEAAGWYESRSNGLSDRFFDDFKALIDHLAMFPESCQIQQRNFRFAKLKRFPYIIVYTYEGNRVYIRNIINAKQEPSKRYK